jgi:[protein-PII] uridylyltransferase
VLYVALLLHDIGKGRPEDHSILGAQIARRVCPRLGLDAEESETVEWLVRYHLLMSDMAQKRDIGDPRTVRDFAKAVKTRKRLDLLTVLTVCDIRGVGPNTWNNWKAMLLRQLYKQTTEALEGGLETLNRENRQEEATRALRERLAGWDEAALEHETDAPLRALLAGPVDRHARGLRAAAARSGRQTRSASTCTPTRPRRHPRLPFALADHPGIFSRLAGALALVGANVVDARTYTSKDGYATAVFWVQDIEGHPYEVSRLPRLRQMIDKTLKGEVVAREALKDRDKIKKREREFRFPTHITFDNEGSEIYTIIEVDTRDRPGLLYDLTRTLAVNNIYIASAVIATYGAQVVDTFYVKDMFGLEAAPEAPARGAGEEAAPSHRRRGRKGQRMSARMIRNIVTLGGWTLVSRGAGLVRELMMAAYLGAGPVADAFNVAFSLPNMFRRFFAEGAFNQAFVPLYAKKLEAARMPRLSRRTPFPAWPAS